MKRRTRVSGYWIVQGTSRGDAEAARKYAELWPAIAAKFDAAILAGPDSHLRKEGEAPARMFIVGFPSYEKAVACYESPEYQAVLPYAMRAYDRSLVILQGK